MDAIKRNQIADYLNVGISDSEEYELMGFGFETLDEDYGAKTDTTCYINQETSSTTLISYDGEFPYTFAYIQGEKALMSLQKTGRNHETGTDAERDYVRVDLFDPVLESSNTYKARKFRVTNIPGSTKGNGGEKVKTDGSLKPVGDPIQGTFNVSTKKFTADSDVE